LAGAPHGLRFSALPAGCSQKLDWRHHLNGLTLPALGRRKDMTGLMARLMARLIAGLIPGLIAGLMRSPCGATRPDQDIPHRTSLTEPPETEASRH